MTEAVNVRHSEYNVLIARPWKGETRSRLAGMGTGSKSSKCMKSMSAAALISLPLSRN